MPDFRLRDNTTLGEEWADYLKGVLPANAPDIQVEECKLAFYAGAYVMFGLVSNAEHGGFRFKVRDSLCG